MPLPARSRQARYAAAVLAVVAATVARAVLEQFIGFSYPLIPFFVALTFAAWYGGLGPAIVALAVSTIVLPSFLPPRGTWEIASATDRVGFALYIVTGSLIALMGGSMRSALRKAEEGVEQSVRDRECLEREVAERRRAEESERLRREQLDATLAGVGDGVIVTDERGRVVSLNPVAESLTGWATAEARGLPLRQVFRTRDVATHLTDDMPVVQVVEEGVGLATEAAEFVARDGTSRAVEHTTSPIKNERGHVTGVVIVFRDVTDRRKAELALKASEERFRQLAEAVPQIVWVSRLDGSIEYMNSRWYEYTGRSQEPLPFRDGWLDVLHPFDRDHVVESSRVAHETGAPFDAEYRLRSKDGGYRWHLGRAVVVRGPDGRPVCRFGTATDIDDRKRSEQDARFLAEASATLAALDDEASALQRIALLAVPHFADWSSVDLIGPTGMPRRMAIGHVDPEMVARATRVLAKVAPDPERGMARVVRTGQPELVPLITDAMLEDATIDPGLFQFLKEIAPRSYICVPMTGRTGTIGALSFLTAESGRRYGSSDLRLAEDLAHRAAVAIENARLLAALEEADRRKTEFLAMLAHELRNPLAPIRNAARLLRQMPELGAAGDEAAIVERQVTHLTRLVDDLLDVSRITQGKIGLKLETVELGEVVGRAVAAVRPTAEERQRVLEVNLPARPTPVHGDPTRLEQIVSNLLSNSVKYTEPGGRIGLSVTEEGNTVSLRVRDNGIGIDPEMLPRVFDLFVQVEPGSKRSDGGLGVGLSLVKSLVDLHGGKITATSEGRGRGSEFVVTLPIAQERTAEPANAAGSPRLADVLPRRKVLIVDDNVDAAKTLGKLLSRVYKQEVRLAHDGRSALDAAAAFLPDLVLLDIGLPDFDGYEVARRLRERDGSSQPLIAALTGWGQDSDLQRSQSAGIDHHFVKPADPSALIALLVEESPFVRS